MRKTLLILCCLGAVATGPASAAQSTTTIVESSSHSVFKGLFKSVWARLRELSPSQKESANAEQVYTAGLRGAEATDTLLKPYWKNDLTEDPDFQSQLKDLSLAQARMDQGELAAAIDAFERFLEAHGDSSLRPNALFGKSLSLAGAGETDAARASMRQFLDENPNHPLAGDARQVIDALD